MARAARHKLQRVGPPTLVPVASSWSIDEEGRAYPVGAPPPPRKLYRGSEIVCEFCGGVTLSSSRGRRQRFCSLRCAGGQRRLDNLAARGEMALEAGP